MGKTIWRELTIAFTFWLMIVLVLDQWMNGFISLILPLTVLEVVWVVNLAIWLWTKRS